MSAGHLKTLEQEQYDAVNRAFSKQSIHYDEADQSNVILKDMRDQVYAHVSKYLRPDSSILELNAGTGIDALHFVHKGHRVLATDLSTGMVREIQAKINVNGLTERLSVQQVSYDQLQQLGEKKFDYVFSNFGGLNCISDLSRVSKNLSLLLDNGAYITWVIMPPVSLWELLWLAKGNVRQAFRRFHKDGVIAHVEGEYFKTYYHSLSQIKKALHPNFQFVEAEGLCVVSPPPSPPDFPVKHPRMYRFLRKVDRTIRHFYPFNRWADHIIVTFKVVS